MRWLALGLTLGVMGAGAVWMALREWTGLGGQRVLLNPPGVVQQIQQLHSLISVKYVLQKVVGLEEQKVPFGTEKLLLIMQAEVLAGVDLDQVRGTNVESDGGRIAISLPMPRVLHVVVDDHETRVWNRSVTWWTPWVPASPDLERQARLAAREAIEKAAIDAGILGRAKENAQLTIRALLMGLGAKSVVFVPGT